MGKVSNLPQTEFVLQKLERVLTRFNNLVESPCYAHRQISNLHTFFKNQFYLFVCPSICPDWYSNGFKRLTARLFQSKYQQRVGGTTHQHTCISPWGQFHFSCVPIRL